jgi:hypothetical protein
VPSEEIPGIERVKALVVVHGAAAHIPGAQQETQAHDRAVRDQLPVDRKSGDPLPRREQRTVEQ